LKLRGYLALVVICTALVVCDLFQRTVIVLRLKLQPEKRVEILGPWINTLATIVMGGVSRIGGASVPVPARVVPSGPGVLIVMNHQSLLDIPLVVQTVDGGYPRIVTRARYRRFIPLISHMVRLYQYPVVDPSANATDLLASVESMRDAARRSDVPFAIFPEGTRTKDGEIGRFKTRGLANVLQARAWTIYVFVVDGFWKAPKFKDFLGGMAHIDGRMAYLGTVEWSDPTVAPEPFVHDLRHMMIDGLAELRGRSSSA